MALICDTSGVYALYDTDDAQHEATAKLIETEHGPLFLPVILLAEIDYLLNRRLGHDAAFEFIEAVEQGDFTLVALSTADFVRCREVVAQYRALEIGLADASIVAAAGRLERHMAAHLRKHPEDEGVHYSDLFEQFLPVTDKPRRLLADWLPEYYFKTTDGTWRPPANEQERKQKTALRQTGTLRRIKRFANALIDGVPVRDRDRPSSDVDLLDWLRQCRRAGLYEQGRAIYEKGGLNLANLTDEQQIEAEDDYRICARRGSDEEAKPKKRQRKMRQNDDE